MKHDTNGIDNSDNNKKVQPKSESKMYALHPPAHKEKRMKNKSQTKKKTTICTFLYLFVDVKHSGMFGIQ